MWLFTIPRVLAFPILKPLVKFDSPILVMDTVRRRFPVKQSLFPVVVRTVPVSPLAFVVKTFASGGVGSTFVIWGIDSPSSAIPGASVSAVVQL